MGGGGNLVGGVVCFRDGGILMCSWAKAISFSDAECLTNKDHKLSVCTLYLLLNSIARSITLRI